MAGGSGTRLWPASNAKTPKQFLSLHGKDSFFNAAVERALAVTNGRVIIIAGEQHAAQVIRACGKYGTAEKARLTLIPEPLAKNTAPAIACGAWYIERTQLAPQTTGESRAVLVLTSDHVISPLETFAANAEAAAAFARKGKLAIFGIPPAGPETGYGYIEAGEEEASGNGTRVFKVMSFREKPGREQAEEYLRRGTFYWNSGMFGFSSAFMLEEFRRSAPECLAPFERLECPAEAAYTVEGGLRVLRNWVNAGGYGLRDAYHEAKAISIDYAIAEKCRETVMAAADFQWLDVGSWDEYAKLKANAAGDGTPAEVYSVNARSCFVDADIPVALCGVEDLIVVVRSGKDGGPASVLISKRGATQGVKHIVEQIKAADRKELL